MGFGTAELQQQAGIWAQMEMGFAFGIQGSASHEQEKLKGSLQLPPTLPDQGPADLTVS